MARVFVSYASEDDYFVDFLTELLKFHRIDVWVDRASLRAGETFTAEIEDALAYCDHLLAIISRHTLISRWVTREISHFKASHPDGVVIPLVLDAEALDEIDEIYDGLSVVHSLKFYESMLQGFRELMRSLDRELFPVFERRTMPDRRSQDRRVAGDRRNSSIDQRLRAGISNAFTKLTGKGDLDPLEMASDVGRLARLLAGENSPLRQFDFVDRKAGLRVTLDFETLEFMAFETWRPLQMERLRAAAYIIDGIVNSLMADYIITSKDRRSEDRRSETKRRKKT
jgi:TIR domain